MSGLELRGLLSAKAPQGPSKAADPGLVTTGYVYAVDVPNRRVQVTVHGSLMWLPAVAGRYKASAGSLGSTAGYLARILLNATTGQPMLVLGPVDPLDTAVLGTVTATGTNQATVTVFGTSYTLPASPGTYTVNQTAWVLLSDWGVPLLVLAPSTSAAASSTSPTAPSSGGSVTASTSVGPQWSGTYRAGQGWNQWNTSRYGGESDIYQGNAYGSGVLTGMATYGDQIVNLGASSIQSISIAVYRWSDSYVNSLTVQGSASGSQPAGAPSGTGSTATSGAVGSGSWSTINLPSDMCENFRTGAIKSLIAVGAAYGGWGGTGTAGAMVMTVDYTRPA